MTEYAELVDRLRYRALPKTPLTDEAARAIEALVKERDAARRMNTTLITKGE